MKYIISFLFFLLVVGYAVAGFAVPVCGDKIYLNIVSGSSTCGGISACPASQIPATYPAGCTSTLNSASASGCVCVYAICCDSAVTTTYEGGTVLVYTEPVPAGTLPATVARNVFNQVIANMTTISPAPGYVQTGEITGMVYDINDALNGDGSMNLTIYKRASFDAIGAVGGGTIAPTLTLSGGSGGGGLSLTDTTTAVSNGIANAIGTGGGVAAGGAIVNQNYATPIIPDGNQVASEYTASANGISNDFSGFLSSLKSTPLFSLPAKLTVNTPVSNNAVVVLEGGIYGHHEYSFASSAWSSVYIVLRTIFMLGFSFVAIRIVILKH